MMDQGPDIGRIEICREVIMPGPKAIGKTLVEVDGRRMTLTNLDKVLYPATGTVKAAVIAYYAEVAPAMLPHVLGRPITRKRWPNGVESEPFFQKNVDAATPDWMPVQRIDHRSGAIGYPLAESPAALAWFGQNGALELHVPQWRFDDAGEPGYPDRMVFDLDPGPAASLADCATVAFWVREILADVGLDAVPVTSGSKGIHLYVGLDRKRDSGEVSAVALRIAQLIETDHPDLVTSKMSKALRPGKVFIDWSQNNGNKTTIAPYSLRGRAHPTVAAPRTWDELGDPDLVQLEYSEVLQRLSDGPDPMAALGVPVSGAEPPAAKVPVDHEKLPATRRQNPATRRQSGAISHDQQELGDEREVGAAGERPAEAAGDGQDRLGTYRAKRSADRTPEPVPGPGPQPHGGNDTFVIQEHHARRLHWDLRLERNGVLASWAVPRGVPDTTAQNRLAVQTEDHPLEYASFSGTIPAGEYGGGDMTIWDAGTYETEKWWSDEVIIRLNGRRAQGRYVLVRTDGKNWLLHRMKDQTGRWAEHPEPPARGSRAGMSRAADLAATPSVTAPAACAGVPAPPTELQPMLATAGTLADVAGGDWRFEGKWDGIRALAAVGGGGLRLTSRTGRDITSGYPELAELIALTAGHSVVLDGEIVAFDAAGRTDFGRLQQRMGLSKPGDVRRVAPEVPVRYYVFDMLWLDGISLLGKAYDDRRRLLKALGPDGEYCSVPGQLDGPAEQALARSAELKWEGILAKKGDGPYRAGQRARTWIKIKNSALQEGIIVGWRPGSGRREGTIGSLLLAVQDPGGLAYIGRVGTGFTDAVLDDLLARLEPLRQKMKSVDGPVPAADVRDAIWVRPDLVGEVRYGEWTHDGRLRHPVWRGLRPDKRPGEVHREG